MCLCIVTSSNITPYKNYSYMRNFFFVVFMLLFFSVKISSECLVEVHIGITGSMAMAGLLVSKEKLMGVV